MSVPTFRNPLLLSVILTALTGFSLPPVAAAASAGGELTVRTADGFSGGKIYLPRAGAPMPCILLLHGSEGGFAGWSHVTAVRFAAQGFAAMPLSYSRGGTPWQAGDIVDVDLDITESALKWLRDNDKIDCTSIGLYGASRGAEHALLLASLLAAEDSPVQPDAVAVHAASDTVRGPFIAQRANHGDKDESRSQSSNWGRAWRWRGGYDQVEPGNRIKIERYPGPLFLSHGEIDKVWSASNTRRLAALMSGAANAPEVHIFPGQGHVLDSEAKNRFYQALFAFFERHLSP